MKFGIFLAGLNVALGSFNIWMQNSYLAVAISFGAAGYIFGQVMCEPIINEYRALMNFYQGKTK